jgi:hypothetical protein
MRLRRPYLESMSVMGIIIVICATLWINAYNQRRASHSTDVYRMSEVQNAIHHRRQSLSQWRIH